MKEEKRITGLNPPFHLPVSRISIFSFTSFLFKEIAKCCDTQCGLSTISPLLLWIETLQHCCVRFVKLWALLRHWWRYSTICFLVWTDVFRRKCVVRFSIAFHRYPSTWSYRIFEPLGGVTTEWRDAYCAHTTLITTFTWAVKIRVCLLPCFCFFSHHRAHNLIILSYAY